MAEKISCFEMKYFWVLNTLTSYLNIFKIRILIQITLCRSVRIQMDPSKNNWKQKIIFLVPRKERRYCIWNAWVLLVFVLLHVPILSWKLKIIAYRGSSTIPPSSMLELVCQYKMTSIVTRSSIIDDMEVRDPSLVCLFSVQNITKKIKT